MRISAIQTKYKGCHFRSRLEARWAVFFDAMNINWQYEPEGFDLADFGWYLPDFRIEYDGMKAWVEVKGGVFGYRDDKGACHVNRYAGQEKTDEFARLIRARGGVMFLLGDIPDPDCNEEIAPLSTMLTTAKEREDGNDFGVINSLWEYCAFTLHEDALGLHPSFVFGNWGWCHIGNGQKDDAFDPSTGTHSIKWRTWWPKRAYEAARSARFEHGETPL